MAENPETTIFTVDAHLDLAMNAMEWNRDLRMPVNEIRSREHGMSDKPDRGKNTVTFDELRKGNIGLVVATQIARYVERGSDLPGWNSPEQAWAHTQGQRAWYRAMEDDGQLTQVYDLKTLEAHLASWNAGHRTTIGYILSLEGADSIVNLKYLEKAYAYGLRAVGPAHYGPGRYAQGTNATGGMGVRGRELLKEMERLNIILDVTHLCDDSFREAMDHFSGHVWASHSNCRSIVDHNRQFNDDQIRELIRRDAVIGAVLDTWMMVPGWVRGVSTPESTNCTLDVLVNHIDHICQIAGNTLHVGIGSDLDGGYGKEQSPADLETIADLQKLPTLLKARGYDQSDVENIMHGNWLRFLRRAWKSA